MDPINVLKKKKEGRLAGQGSVDQPFPPMESGETSKDLISAPRELDADSKPHCRRVVRSDG